MLSGGYFLKSLSESHFIDYRALVNSHLVFPTIQEGGLVMTALGFQLKKLRPRERPS